MNWRVPACITILILLGWLSIWDALRSPVIPDELDLEARKAAIVGFGE